MPISLVHGVADEQLSNEERDWLLSNDPAVLLRDVPDRLPDRKIRLFAVACARRIHNLLKNPSSVAAINAAEMYADKLISDEQLQEYEQAARVASSDAVREAHAVWALGPAATTARAAWVSVWASCAAENCCDRNVEMAPNGSLEAGFQGNLGIRTAQVAAWAMSVHNEITRGDEEEVATETALFFSFLRGLKNTVQQIEQAVRDGENTCETVQQSFIVRDLLGNPFRPRQFDPDWRTEEVVNMASEAYASPSSGQLAIIADALEHDGGCTNQEILRHLRGTEHAMRILRLNGCTNTELLEVVDRSHGPHDLTSMLRQIAHDATAEDAQRILAMIPILTNAQHVRGCWVLDHILKKA